MMKYFVALFLFIVTVDLATGANNRLILELTVEPIPTATGGTAVSGGEVIVVIEYCGKDVVTPNNKGFNGVAVRRNKINYASSKWKIIEATGVKVDQGTKVPLTDIQIMSPTTFLPGFLGYEVATKSIPMKMDVATRVSISESDARQLPPNDVLVLITYSYAD